MLNHKLPRAQDVLVQKGGRQFVDFTRFHDTVPIKEQPVAGADLKLPAWLLGAVSLHFPAPGEVCHSF